MGLITTKGCVAEFPNGMTIRGTFEYVSDSSRRNRRATRVTLFLTSPSGGVLWTSYILHRNQLDGRVLLDQAINNTVNAFKVLQLHRFPTTVQGVESASALLRQIRKADFQDRRPDFIL